MEKDQIKKIAEKHLANLTYGTGESSWNYFKETLNLNGSALSAIEQIVNECGSQKPETSDEALPIADVVERKAGRITVNFFRKVYKQFIDEQISMTKMLELMTEQAHRTDVCIKCQRPLDGTNCSKDKCNACFTVNA
jgi:hypothetical protein